jgi:hypothetical protein
MVTSANLPFRDPTLAAEPNIATLDSANPPDMTHGRIGSLAHKIVIFVMAKGGSLAA